jgi:hypothetical protein
VHFQSGLLESNGQLAGEPDPPLHETSIEIGQGSRYKFHFFSGSEVVHNAESVDKAAALGGNDGWLGNLYLRLFTILSCPCQSLSPDSQEEADPKNRVSPMDLWELL